MGKNRDLSFDYIKGILIFLVVWGHLIEFSLVDHSAIYYDTLRKAVYSFHMPLFVFISGWFFSSKGSFVDLIKKQFKRLLVPQFTFVILGLFLYFFLFVLNTEKGLSGYLIRIPLQFFPMYLAFLFFKQLYAWNFLRNIFLFWSKDTLLIYVFHIFVIGLLGPLHLFFSLGPKVANYVFYASIALIVCFIIGLLSQIMRKNEVTRKLFLGEK